MSKIRKSAKGEYCQVRIPTVCNHDPYTTVLAHMNGGGMGMKQPDYLATYTCSTCHDYIDGRIRGKFDPDQVKLWFYEGVFRTQKILEDKGLLKVGS